MIPCQDASPGWQTQRIRPDFTIFVGNTPKLKQFAENGGYLPLREIDTFCGYRTFRKL